MRRRNKDSDVETILRRAVSPISVEYLLNGSRYIIGMGARSDDARLPIGTTTNEALSVYHPPSKHEYMRVGAHPPKSPSITALCLCWKGRLHVGHGVETMGREHPDAGAPRLTAFLSVFTLCEIAAWAIRSSRPRTTTMRQSAIIRIFSTSCQFHSGWLKFDEESAARPINRKAIAMKSAAQRKGKRKTAYSRKFEPKLRFRGGEKASADGGNAVKRTVSETGLLNPHREFTLLEYLTAGSRSVRKLRSQGVAEFRRRVKNDSRDQRDG